jgi:hypothetical protein
MEPLLDKLARLKIIKGIFTIIQTRDKRLDKVARLIGKAFCTNMKFLRKSPIPHLIVFALALVVLVMMFLPLGFNTLLKETSFNNLDAIHQAARDGNLAKVKAFLKNNPDLVFSRDYYYHETPLYNAIEHNQWDVAELLLANKAEVNITNNAGQTPLHSAADGDHKDIAELLLSNGADINAKDNHSETPLRLAVMGDCKDVAEFLRQHGGHE